MKLFPKGKAAAGPAAQPAAFRPIDRNGLLGLLDQVVNGGQSGVLELHEPRGNWVYAFQAGALTHASGGRVRGARQAFDLLWEFQSGEFMFVPGVNPSLAGNLYIDKGRLLDLLRRSVAVLQGPSAPYIPPGQQRPIAPVPRPYSPPNPGQMPPAWQPGMQQPQGWPPAAPGMPPMQPGMPPAQPGMAPAPAWAAGYPQQPAPPGYAYPGPGQPYVPQVPGQPYPGQAPGQPYPPQAFPAYPGQQPGQPPVPAAMPPAAPPFAVQPPAAPAPPRPMPSFSVPPMPIPKKREAVPAYQPPAAAPPAAPAPQPAAAAPPKDDLAALRASLVAQAPAVRPAPAANWNVRQPDGTAAPAVPQPAVKGGKGKGKDKKAKGDPRVPRGFKLQLIKFLLWACERRYSPDDHWTLKDAFEVSTMELRDQFVGAFSQTLKSTAKPKSIDDEEDDLTAGRMRGRGRRH